MSADPGDAVRCGSASEFGAVVHAYGRELRVHCYRLVGSRDAAEDLVQETFLRAWRARASFEGRATARTWLYRIATNVCLDAMRRDRHRVRLVPTAAIAGGSSPDEAAWRAPALDEGALIGVGESEPEAAVVARERIESALLTAVRHLSPRQRAVLILRDGLGWTAREAAQAIDTSVAAANSALQRARATLSHLTRAGHVDRAAAADPTPDELEVLARCLGVLDRYAASPTDRGAPAVRDLLDPR